jgi:hypothetical protein
VNYREPTQPNPGYSENEIGKGLTGRIKQIIDIVSVVTSIDIFYE